MKRQIRQREQPRVEMPPPVKMSKKPISWPPCWNEFLKGHPIDAGTGM